LLFPAAMVTGHLAYERGVVAGLIGPISHLLAAGLPVLVAVVLVRRLGPELPKRRAWGQFLAGLWITPAGALTLELLALIPAAAALIVALRSSIDFRSLGNLMIGPDSLNSPEYASLLQSLILKPWVIVIIVGYVAVMVPIIEETLKSIAVWPFLRRGMTPAEAFLSGTLAGAGYALFEAMFLTQPGQGWAETMLARVGASFVHVLTAGLSSWGLVQGFHYRRWERCILAALAAVMIHGLWNASAIGIGISSVAQEVGLTTIPAGIWPLIGEIGAVLLALIGGMALVAPIAIARRLGRTDSETASQTSAIP
jgi:PrsW family intramembrane metalloprotease